MGWERGECEWGERGGVSGVRERGVSRASNRGV